MACPYCGSQSTRMISHDLTLGAGQVKIWRGRRFGNYRCSTCGREFYAEEPAKNGGDRGAETMIEDEEQLRAAEEELKRDTDSKNDHRFWPND